MSDEEINNLIRVLRFLKKEYPDEFFPDEISKKTRLPEDAVNGIVDNACLNQWVDIDHRNDDWIPAIRINQFGNKKLNTLLGTSDSLPEKPNEIHYHFYNTRSGKGWIIGIVVAIIIGVAGMWWTSHVAENSTSQIPETSSIKTTMINQDIIDCEMLPDGQSGLSYYNKTLGFSLTLPNINWSIVEDDGYYISQFGLIEHEKYIGGIMIDQKQPPKLLISVFDDSEQEYLDIENFLNDIGSQIGKKMEWKYVTITIDPDKDSGNLETEGLYRDRGFYIFERALRTNDKIYLIHYPNFDNAYSENIIEEIDQMYLSVNIFPACEI